MYKFIFYLTTLINLALSKQVITPGVLDPCLCFPESCNTYQDKSYCFVIGYEHCEYAHKSNIHLDENGDQLYYLLWYADDCPKFNFIQ